MNNQDFQFALPLAELKAAGRKVLKISGKQLALFWSDGEIYVCNNRCPHEGYPLSEGSLADGCVLTCNWHNWKFDLAKGDTLVGGDKLRLYPIELRDGNIHVDVADPPAQDTIQSSLENLHDSFHRFEYDRMAREIARLEKAGGDPLDAVRKTLEWTAEHFEYGMSHAQAAATDWLALRDEASDNPERSLSTIVEIVSHFAWDTLRYGKFPYCENIAPYDADGLVQAIEDEDQDRAIAIARGAVAEGLSYGDIEEALARAALAHYQSFGHALIYVLKTGQLFERLGQGSLEVLLLPLIRGLVYASREDLIPEFKSYAPAMEAWDATGDTSPSSDDFVGLGISRALALVASAGGDIPGLFDALMGANAKSMLMFDLPMQSCTDNSVSRNIGWLDFTHGLTFGNAVRTLCTRYPALWSAGLMQMACFSGRNAGFLDQTQDVAQWQVNDPAAWLAEQRQGLYDHGQIAPIVACHLVKLLTAMSVEVDNRPDAPWIGDAVAAVNRFLNSPLKRRHVARTAHQALEFVAAEG